MSLQIIKAGILDTLQDNGRYHFQHLGINPGGPMDRFSAHLANALLGKPPDALPIEMSFPAASIYFQESTIICLAGADFTPVIKEQVLKLHQPVWVPGGSLLEFRTLKAGRWCYLSLAHDLDAQNWLGSCSTNTKINTGGHHGRRLQTGDRIAFARKVRFTTKEPREAMHLPWQAKEPVDCKARTFRLLLGNEWNRLTPEAALLLTTPSFSIGRQSDRMGYRLLGPELNTIGGEQMVSSAVTEGTLQLLPNGQLIVLMADHQTTGGYPRIGHVAASDLPALAQQQTGTVIGFTMTDLQTAERAYLQQQTYLQQLRTAASFHINKYIHASL